MSTEKLVEKFGQEISRRSFLAKLGASAVSALLGLMGLPSTTSAAAAGCNCCKSYKCCVLCCEPDAPCSNGCADGQNAGEWCWTCYYAPEDREYRCCECKAAGANCQGDCSGVYGSYFYPLIPAIPPPDLGQASGRERGMGVMGSHEN